MVPEGRATLPNTFATSAFGSLSENRLAALSTKKAAHANYTMSALEELAKLPGYSDDGLTAVVPIRAVINFTSSHCHLAAPAPACKLTRRLRDGVRDGTAPSDGLARGQPS